MTDEEVARFIEDEAVVDEVIAIDDAVVSIPEDPNPLGADIEKVAANITGGEGHGSADARHLVVIQKLPPRENLKPAERIRLLDSDIREAMALAARRLDAEAMKYSAQGFEWWLEDIHYDMGGPRTVVATAPKAVTKL